MFELRIYNVYGFEIAKCLGKHKSLDNCMRAVRGYFSKPMQGYSPDEIQIVEWDRHPWGIKYNALLNIKGAFSGYEIEAKVIDIEQ